MTTRSRLDEIEDFHFAVNKFIHEGKSVDEVTEMLRKRGADEKQIIYIFDSINESYQGIRLLESGKLVRFLNFIIDTFLICFLWYFVFSETPDNKERLLIVLAVPFIYYVLLEILFGQTLGKFITGSIVVAKDGKKPNLLKIIIRTGGRFFLNKLPSAFQDGVFHDKISQTYTVNKQRWRAKYEVV